MDIKEFEARISRIIVETGMDSAQRAGGQDVLDTTARIEEFNVLEQELRDAITNSDKPEVLQDILEMFLSVRASLSGPSYQKPAAFNAASGASVQPPIFDSIEAGDIGAVRIALKSWDVNAQMGDHATSALYHAMTVARGASLEIIHLLLDAGADPRRGLGEINVLHGIGLRVWRGVSAVDLSEVVKRCIGLGADIEERTTNLAWTPLMHAVFEQNDVASEALLLAGANPHVQAHNTIDANDPSLGIFSGADCLSLAEGHLKTTAILKTFMTRN